MPANTLLHLMQIAARTYRLALLLTGTPAGAARVTREVLAARGAAAAIDEAHLDRLTILRARDVLPARIADDRLESAAAAALATMGAQRREAWILADVYRLPVREVACAMDCSKTAAARHLDAARSVIGERGAEFAAALQAWALAVDVPSFSRRRLPRVDRRSLRTVAGILIVILLTAAIMLIASRYLVGNE